MMDNPRINGHPILRFDRGKKIRITFNGRSVSAYERETIAAALYVSGVRIFSRSMKYHRPRGLFCLSGHCSHCLMRVNGKPNVRVCRTPVENGMIIEFQNAWPSLKFDIAAISGKFNFLLHPGFYYRYFIKPRWLYHIWERFLRNAAGIGKIEDRPAPYAPVERKQASPQILVVGGGIAGMNAAINAVNKGADVWLIEREHKLGGRFRYDTREVDVDGRSGKKYAFEIVDEMAKKLVPSDHLHILTGTLAFGWYDEGILAATRASEFWEFEPKCTIISTGSYETPFVFENNDLPGVFLAGGIQRLMHRDGVLPGKRAVVITGTNEGYVIAKQLHQAGVAVAAVVDGRNSQSFDGCPEKKFMVTENISVFPHHRIASAIGVKHVRGAVIKPVSVPGKGTHATKIKIGCDIICVAGFRTPANDLLFQRGCEGTYILTCPDNLMRKTKPDKHLSVKDSLYVAGEANGRTSIRKAFLEGEIAGLAAVNHSGSADPATGEKIQKK